MVFLNHGSFGACPRPVFEAYQRWQLELERQPVEFLVRRSEGLLGLERRELGGFLGAPADDLVFVTNVTAAVNLVAHGLDLGPGDEVLGTDHEYGACVRAFRFHSARRGYAYLSQPVRDPETMVDELWEGVTPRTRLLLVSHLTSPTALVFPVAEVCRRAREAGILTLIDGAHAPGQLDLDLSVLGADLYTGNLHKWLNAPKGCAFLYATPEVQQRLRPLIVSWGWEPKTPPNFLAWHQGQGTRDLSAFLSTSAAIEYHRRHLSSSVRAACRGLARRFHRSMQQRTDLRTPVSDAQLAAARLPEGTDVDALKERLYDRHRVEMPVYLWNGQPYVRIACQAYNSSEEVDYAVEAILAEIT
ncbi:MAG: aminotransferase class V-fold PLP-dependent enzyme [Candidatus Eremiobacterota bacterium]